METSGRRYSACMGDVGIVAHGISYELFLRSIMEFTIRAAIARSIEESEWEHDELRRRGLEALQILHAGKAVWVDRACFESQFAEEALHGDSITFAKNNELDPDLLERLEKALIARWRVAGYDVPRLRGDMKKLFTELEADARDLAREARDSLVGDILCSISNPRSTIFE